MKHETSAACRSDNKLIIITCDYHSNEMSNYSWNPATCVSWLRINFNASAIQKISRLTRPAIGYVIWSFANTNSMSKKSVPKRTLFFSYRTSGCRWKLFHVIQARINKMYVSPTRCTNVRQSVIQFLFCHKFVDAQLFCERTHYCACRNDAGRLSSRARSKVFAWNQICLFHEVHCNFECWQCSSAARLRCV